MYLLSRRPKEARRQDLAMHGLDLNGGPLQPQLQPEVRQEARQGGGGAAAGAKERERANTEAGATEVIILVQERVVPESWAAYISKAETELGLKIESIREEAPLGNAGAFKAAEASLGFLKVT